MRCNHIKIDLELRYKLTLRGHRYCMQCSDCGQQVPANGRWWQRAPAEPWEVPEFDYIKQSNPKQEHLF